MAYDFKDLKAGIKSTEEWLRSEFSGIRTGRATPALLDSVMVEAYGAMMPINQVGSISVEDARMMRVTPWDMSLAKAVEKAIMLADLGLSLAVDEKGVRVIFPDLTADRRASLVKLAKQKLEDARIAIRSEREKTIKDIVYLANNNAQSGDAIVLSPGFPSFDMFKDFEDRGNQFRAVVKAL